MRTLDQITITDPTGFPKSEYTFLDKIFLHLLRDTRDLPFMYLLLKITVFMIVPAIAMYLTGGILWWALAVVYFYLNNLYFKGPFGLMLHCVSHRPLFKKEFTFLNYYITWIVAPFFGQIPETYFAHHIGMHHAENNMEEDESSTLEYERDRLSHFLVYVGKFVIGGVTGLFGYLKKKNRKMLIQRILIGQIAFLALVVALSFVDIATTFIVFIFPVVVFRVIAMLGNWTQHAFVDPKEPDNPFRNSITCLNVKYNHKCWNDGYHTGHHLKPHKHWTDYPGFFIETKDQYASNRSVVFEGIDYLKVFVLLMKRNYNKLAEHFVNVNNTFQSKEEVISLLRERTKRIPAYKAA